MSSPNFTSNFIADTLISTKELELVYYITSDSLEVEGSNFLPLPTDLLTENVLICKFLYTTSRRYLKLYYRNVGDDQYFPLMESINITNWKSDTTHYIYLDLRKRTIKCKFSILNDKKVIFRHYHKSSLIPMELLDQRTLIDTLDSASPIYTTNRESEISNPLRPVGISVYSPPEYDPTEYYNIGFHTYWMQGKVLNEVDVENLSNYFLTLINDGTVTAIPFLNYFSALRSKLTDYQSLPIFSHTAVEGYKKLVLNFSINLQLDFPLSVKYSDGASTTIVHIVNSQHLWVEELSNYVSGNLSFSESRISYKIIPVNPTNGILSLGINFHAMDAGDSARFHVGIIESPKNSLVAHSLVDQLDGYTNIPLIRSLGCPSPSGCRNLTFSSFEMAGSDLTKLKDLDSDLLAIFTEMGMYRSWKYIDYPMLIGLATHTYAVKIPSGSAGIIDISQLEIIDGNGETPATFTGDLIILVDESIKSVITLTTSTELRCKTIRVNCTKRAPIALGAILGGMTLNECNAIITKEGKGAGQPAVYNVEYTFNCINEFTAAPEWESGGSLSGYGTTENMYTLNLVGHFIFINGSYKEITSITIGMSHYGPPGYEVPVVTYTMVIGGSEYSAIFTDETLPIPNSINRILWSNEEIVPWNKLTFELANGYSKDKHTFYLHSN